MLELVALFLNFGSVLCELGAADQVLQRTEPDVKLDLRIFFVEAFDIAALRYNTRCKEKRSTSLLFCYSEIFSSISLCARSQQLSTMGIACSSILLPLS